MNKFPILGSKPKEYIPLEIIKPHEKQAIRNHGQTLKRLAERGGLDWIEALCVLEDREYDFHTKLTEEIARIKVLEVIKDEKKPPYRVICIDDNCCGELVESRRYIVTKEIDDRYVLLGLPDDEYCTCYFERI